MLWITAAHSQPSPERYVVDQWTVEDGLSVNSINKVIQSQKGYLWMATFDGLVRFDGVRFKIFDSAGYPGMPSNRILDITEAPDSSLWMETEQSFLVRYRNGVFTHIGPDDGYNGTLVHTLMTDPKGNIWMGSEKGITVYRDGKLSAFKPERIKGVIDRLYVQKNGTVWFRDHQNKMLYRFVDDTLHAVTRTKTAYDLVPFAETNDGLWFGTGHGLYRFAEDKLTLASGFFTGDAESYYMGEDSEGFLQIATKADGLFGYEFENEIPAQLLGNHEFLTAPFYTGDSGDRWIISAHQVYHNGELVYQSDPEITDYLFDREGNLWLGTYSDGLYRLKPNPFTIYSESEGLPDDNVYPIIEAEDGSVWVGTHGSGAAHIKNGKVDAGYLPVGNEGAAYVRTLCQRKDGSILMGLSGAGVWRLQGHSFYRYPSPQILATSTVASIFEDSRGRLWIGSRGLFLKNNGSWMHFDTRNGFPYHTVRFITEAPDGTLWMATNGGGIVHFFDKDFEVYNEADGLSDNLVRALHIENTGEPESYLLWIGSEGKGLSRLPVADGVPDFSGITHYRVQDGLFDNGIHRILADGKGFFWMSSNRGIFRVAKSELEAFRRGELEKVRSVAFTEADGMPNREANGGMQPAGIRSSDGRLWFPTQDGVVIVDPDNIQSNQTPPPVVIETVTADERLLWEGNEISLELKEDRNFEITYTALSLPVPEKNQFKYKLSGFDDEWRNPGSRRTAFYTNISPGDYTFRVIASNNNGVWNEIGASLDIVVMPYFYETGWFYVLCGTIFVLLIIGGIRMRTRRLEEAEQRLTAIVKERTHELSLEKKKTEKQAEELKKLDEVKSRFFANISHEFRTPLTLIMNPLKQLMSGAMGILPDAVNIRHQLMMRNSYRLLRLIDQLLDLSKLEEGRLRLRIKEVELISFTRKICELFEHTAEEKGLSVTVHNTGSEYRVWIDTDKMEKVIANLLSNAIKYTDPGGAIDIRFGETETTCEIMVCDTGKGIPKAKEQHIFDRFYQVDSGDTRKSEGVGVGLALVKEFIELHKGKISIESEEGEGTCFTVMLKKGRAHFSDEELISDADVSDNPVEDLPVPSYLLKNDPGTEIFGEETEPLAKEADKTTVLVVEDNADLRGFLCEMLSQTYRVFEAGDGQAALNLIQEELPDLIVADIMMPGMDGRRLNRELKKDPSLASIPLIFLTAKAASEEKIEGFAEGADAYLTKPFDAEVLKARIDNLIESRMRLRNLLREEKNGQPPGTRKDVEDPFLMSVNEVLEEKFSHPELSVSSLADSLHMDRTRLYRKLKEKTDLTPQQYILRFRLRKAAMLFREQRGSVSEVAYAVGFKSLSYFARQFREQFEMNPSEYLSERKDIQ